MRKVTTIAVVLAALLGGPSLASAQDGASMEKIVAVVGKDIILKSDVEGQVQIYIQQNPGAKTNDPELRQKVLDMLINERLIVTKATEDSVEVTDDEVTQQMEYQISMLAQQFGSEQRIEQVYGMSMARIRREFRDEIRKQLLGQKMRQQKFANVKATRVDVESFYERYKDSLKAIPPRVQLAHIVKYIKPSDTQKKEALELSKRIRDSVIAGGSFGDFARRYSADPGTAQHGGDLGYVEKGKLMPSYESAAFALQPGEISQPVETPFGFHVIQLIEKTPSTINTRHILFRVGQTEDDKKKASDFLLDLKARVENGASFEDLAKQFSEEKETQGFGGAMGDIEISRLPDEMRTIVTDLKDGGVSAPLPYAADPTKPGFHILYRKRVLIEHKPTLEEDYKTLEQMATVEKTRRLETEWIQELRKTMYWEIRN
ncbi:MAG: peptidylprolyl isomerase [Bacteroidetes bacterium]|nr:peptidylprolyl isomerase [Bacteroidota bacterium]